MLKIDTKFELPDSWLKVNHNHAPFGQSFDWEDILRRENRNVERLMIFDDDKPVAMAFIEYHSLFFGWSYAFCPNGPIFLTEIKKDSKKILDIFNFISKYLKQNKCIFFRFESSILPNSSDKICKKVVDFNPRATLILALNKMPDELLGQMHTKTRYNIRLAERKGLVVSDKKDTKLFMSLMQKTAKRDGFNLHLENHYNKIISSPLSYQLTIFKDENPVAVAIFIGFGNTFTYLFGASDYKYRSSMAPYLLQWSGIKLGQRYGYHYYDFFGIAPLYKADNKVSNQYDAKHQYAGVTRFKLGFGGQYTEQPGTHDFIIVKWKYKIYTLLRKIRRLF